MPRGANREDPWELLDASLTVEVDRLRWRRRKIREKERGDEEVARPGLVRERELFCAHPVTADRTNSSFSFFFSPRLAWRWPYIYSWTSSIPFLSAC